jgi:transcriptional regulator with XRE-family HTH domain
MRTTIDTWLSESRENQRLFAQEGLILEATEELWAAMERTATNKADLAKLLNTSKANITQLLNGNRNLTLRTLADIAFALGQTVRIEIASAEKQADGWKDIFHAIRPMRRGASLHITANDEWTENAVAMGSR